MDSFKTTNSSRYSITWEINAWAHNPLVVVWVDAYGVCFKIKRKLAIFDLFQFILMQIRPSPYSSIDYMWKPFPSSNLKFKWKKLVIVRGRYILSYVSFIILKQNHNIYMLYFLYHIYPIQIQKVIIWQKVLQLASYWETIKTATIIISRLIIVHKVRKQ